MAYAVEVTDHHPTLGGKSIKAPFAYRAHAELWAREEVAAAKKLGIANVTTRVYRLA
jgi:hypothetical protein